MAVVITGAFLLWRTRACLYCGMEWRSSVKLGANYYIHVTTQHQYHLGPKKDTQLGPASTMPLGHLVSHCLSVGLWR